MNYAKLERAIRRRSAAEVIAALYQGGLWDVAKGARPMQATRHPLGFACLPLYRNGTDGVCVHIRPAGTKQTLTTSEVHCHSWDLLSYVLFGGVFNQCFHIVDTEDGPWRVFRVRSSGDTDHITPTDRLVDLKSGEPTLYGGGEFYELPAGAFHASSQLPDSSATTVVLGRYHPEIADLTLGRPAITAHPMWRRRYTEEETAALAQQLIMRLASLEQSPSPVAGLLVR